MEAIQILFSQYSIESTIILIILLLLIAKFINELYSYFSEQFNEYFNKKNKVDKQHEEIKNELKKINNKLDDVYHQNEQLEDRQKIIENQAMLTQERLQENTRSYIIDAHHRFCYQIGGIDDINLQSIERRYLYYKTAGGNSFIDNLMDEIRKLPKLNMQDDKIVKILHDQDRR